MLSNCNPVISRLLARSTLSALHPRHHLLRAFTTRPAVNYVDANESATVKPTRPLSPHLTIYEPQLTWLMSIAHRFTGVGLSAGIYAFGIYYALAQPANLTTNLAGWIAHDCPAALVYAGKYVLAAPFLYHILNGIRHLVIYKCNAFLSFVGLGCGLGIVPEERLPRRVDCKYWHSRRSRSSCHAVNCKTYNKRKILKHTISLDVFASN